jgi:hypothetical protein
MAVDNYAFLDAKPAKRRKLGPFIKGKGGDYVICKTFSTYPDKEPWFEKDRNFPYHKEWKETLKEMHRLQT